MWKGDQPSAANDILSALMFGQNFALSVKGCSEQDYVIPTLIKGHHTLPQGEEEALLDS
jgi:hypothetical protein